MTTKKPVTVSVQVDEQVIRGSGKNLYSLIMIDTDDSEDSTLQLWRADDEDHLYDQVLEDFQGDADDSMKEALVFDFENELWGLLWLPKLIGKIE